MWDAQDTKLFFNGLDQPDKDGDRIFVRRAMNFVGFTKGPSSVILIYHVRLNASHKHEKLLVLRDGRS